MAAHTINAKRRAILDIKTPHVDPFGLAVIMNGN
jgi:hypothetical protein